MAEFAKEAANYERDVRKECGVLLKKEDEWELKNRSVSQLTRMVAMYQDSDIEKIQEVFGMSIFRVLKEPIKQMMSDLRSQQVRDTCTFLSTMSVVLGDHMRHFLRDIFPCVLDGVKQTNKVMSGYVDECIVTMIRNTTFKTSIPIIIEQIQSSKSKQYRERCIDYTNEIIVSWDITERDAEMLSEAIKTGLEDASVRCREISRLAYLNMFQMFPQKTETLKSELSKAVQKRLNQEEDKFLASEEYQQGQRELENYEEEDRISNQTSKPALRSPQAASSSSSVGEADLGDDEGSDLISVLNAPPTISRGNTAEGRSPVSLRTRRQSVEEGSVTSIQAVVRGALSRRLSSLRAPDLQEHYEDKGTAGTPADKGPGANLVVESASTPAPGSALKSTRGALTTDNGTIPAAASAALLESPTHAPPPPRSNSKKAKVAPHHSNNSTTKITAVNGNLYSSTGKFGKGVTPSKTAEKTKRKPAPQPREALPMGPLSKECRQEALGLLKLKVNFMMTLVEKNMTVLRSLEGSEEAKKEPDEATLDENTVNQIIDLSGEEIKLCRNFEDRLNTMLLKQSKIHERAQLERSPLEEEFASV